MQEYIDELKAKAWIGFVVNSWCSDGSSVISEEDWKNTWKECTESACDSVKDESFRKKSFEVKQKFNKLYP